MALKQIIIIKYFIFIYSPYTYYNKFKRKKPYDKIIGLNNYQDGMGVQQDGANAKRLIFQGFDCSFVLNIMSFISV